MGQSESPAGQEQIFAAASIVTMTTGAVQAFACRGQWVVATGSLGELRERFPRAEIRDFGDACVVPGFNDAHQHPTVCAEQALQVDLSPKRVSSTSEVVRALRARAEQVPAGEWVLGWGYDPFRSNGGRDLTRDDLDTVGADHPVLVVHATLHAGVVSSRGLELAHLRTRADAPSGGELAADASGRLTGVVHDQALYDLAFPAFTRRETVVPPPATARLAEGFQSYVRRLHAAGITSVGDAMVGPAGWELMRSIADAGELSIRVNALASYEHFGYFKPLGQGSPADTERLRLGGVKAFADGAVGGGTCLVDEPVTGAAGHGLERMSATELAAVVRDVHDAGWRACVHANGDRAIERVLDAVEAAQRARPRNDPRHRIEHASIVTPAILERMHDLGIVAVPFASYVLTLGDKLLGFYGARRSEWMFAHRAMLDRGVPVAASSDYPCGPYEPLFGMQSCVSRTDPAGTPFGASQRISIREALALYTTGAAYASGEERVKGRLAPGYLSDFTVLAENPLTKHADDLASIGVRETWVGARLVWSG